MVRPAAPAIHRGTAQHPRRTDEVHHAALGDTDYVGNPYCEKCGTDDFVYLESFVPASRRRDGSVSKLAEVTYFCSGCEDYSAHAVPASWAPPGWYLG